MKTVGVLGLQGCVSNHFKHLKMCGVNFKSIKTVKEILECDAYILPGGESSVMLKLLSEFNLTDVLIKELKKKPFWGICAGCILVAKSVTNPTQHSFDLIDLHVKRNAYGRQNESFKTKINNYEVSFIRAPIITSTAEKVLASFENNPVWVANDKCMVTTFHPELNNDAPSPMHRFFCDMIS